MRRRNPRRQDILVEFRGRRGARHALRVSFARAIPEWTTYVWGGRSDASGWWIDEVSGKAALGRDGQMVLWINDIHERMTNLTREGELDEARGDPLVYLKERYGLPFFVAMQSALP